MPYTRLMIQINFSNLNYLKTRGVGFNVKVGIIGMPIQNLRLSLSLQTPGILFMRDAYLTSMEVDYAVFKRNSYGRFTRWKFKI